jgi:hypothetical protein
MGGGGRMKDCFILSGLNMKRNPKNDDSKIGFKLETSVGPGYRHELYDKLDSLDNQQVIVTIEPVQSSINHETGEVA